MASPTILQPVLYSKSELTSNSSLTAAFRELTNEAYFRPRATNPSKWNTTGPRFPTLDSVHDMLTDDSMVALIFEVIEGFSPGTGTSGDVESKTGHVGQKVNKLVACAAARPWKGGWTQEGAGTEVGWEINALSVDGGEKYLRRGLALQVLVALENRVVETEKQRSRREDQQAQEVAHGGAGNVCLWVLAAECLNGAYWRKRGYTEVRRKTEGVGVWNCRTSFEMIVFRKDLPYEI